MSAEETIEAAISAYGPQSLSDLIREVYIQTEGVERETAQGITRKALSNLRKLGKIFLNEDNFWELTS